MKTVLEKQRLGTRQRVTGAPGHRDPPAEIGWESASRPYQPTFAPSVIDSLPRTILKCYRDFCNYCLQYCHDLVKPVSGEKGFPGHSSVRAAMNRAVSGRGQG